MRSALRSLQEQASLRFDVLSKFVAATVIYVGFRHLDESM